MEATEDERRPLAPWYWFLVARPEGVDVRKLIFIAFILLGAAAGLLSAVNDGIGVTLVMASIGAFVGLVIGGALARIGVGVGRRHRPGTERPQGVLEELDRNYWRDRGHPVFMKPTDALPDRHMFDPDRQH